MKKSFDGRFIALLAGSALILMSGVAQAAIANSKHDLSSTSTGGSSFSGTAEICVFCHTPHGSDTSASVPLWNKSLPLSSTFTTYASLNTTSLMGKVTAVGSVSIACLSCHDGQAAINTVLNAPGSGGYNATGAAMTGTWTSTTLTGGKITNAITNIGQDLRNDHPVGIQYGGGKSTEYVAGTNYAATDFVNADFMAIRSVSSKADWYVDAGTVANTKDKGDLLLYTRTDATTGLSNPQPFVECATCHDPHNTANGTFLRKSNAGSALCLACHNK